MSTHATKDHTAKTATELAALVPINVERLTRASERFVEGMTTLFAQQVELGRLMVEGGVEDFKLLAQATTPEAFIKAEMEVLNRRQERAATAVQKFSDGFTKAFSEVYEVVERPHGSASADPSPTPKPPT